MESNYSRFLKGDWDYLIVLDACRFDYFSYFYKYFFEGNLAEIYSLGSHTLEWSKNTFRDYYEDIVYISSSPFINSIISIAGFDAGKHFFKVADVWRFGWNIKLGTVHPGTVNIVALSLKDKYPNKRFILHYLQPHAPYISKKYFLYDSRFMFHYFGAFRMNSKVDQLHERFINILKGKIRAKMKTLFFMRLIELLGRPPTSPMDLTRRKFGITGVRKAYAENLIIVLSTINSLVPKLSGNVVITSDHGEFLGENRMFFHPAGYNDPILRNVPWLEVNRVKNIPMNDIKIYHNKSRAINARVYYGE